MLRRQAKCALHGKVAVSTSLLRPQNKQKRWLRATTYQNYFKEDWQNLLFVDEGVRSTEIIEEPTSDVENSCPNLTLKHGRGTFRYEVASASTGLVIFTELKALSRHEHHSIFQRHAVQRGMVMWTRFCLAAR